jgi:hypothetical protein
VGAAGRLPGLDRPGECRRAGRRRIDAGLCALRQSRESQQRLMRIPMMPISRPSGSRSVIPIDPDQRGVSAPLDAFLISVFSTNVKHG